MPSPFSIARLSHHTRLLEPPLIRHIGISNSIQAAIEWTIEQATEYQKESGQKKE
jgi:hypothetical protein